MLLAGKTQVIVSDTLDTIHVIFGQVREDCLGRPDGFLLGGQMFSFNKLSFQVALPGIVIIFVRPLVGLQLLGKIPLEDLFHSLIPVV